VLPLHIQRQSPQAEVALYDFQNAVKRMARVSLFLNSSQSTPALPTLDGAHPIVAKATDLRWVAVETLDVSARLKLPESFDLNSERARLKKAVEAAAKERDSLAARLNNPAFTERAKPEAVDKARADHDARAAEAERLSAALARLG
jgi:valyl-tRNA synthetase